MWKSAMQKIDLGWWLERINLEEYGWTRQMVAGVSMMLVRVHLHKANTGVTITQELDEADYKLVWIVDYIYVSHGGRTRFRSLHALAQTLLAWADGLGPLV